MDSIDATYKSLTPRDYLISLNTNPVGVNYFRIKTLDWDNPYSYSKVFVANCLSENTNYLHDYLNPFSNQFNIITNIANEQLLIEDVLGKTYPYSETLIK